MTCRFLPRSLALRLQSVRLPLSHPDYSSSSNSRSKHIRRINLNPMKISGSLIVVTGGSRGLGAATTQLLCQRGARVLILDMQAPTFDNVPESSAYWPGKCDVGSEQDVSDCLARGLAKLGGKDWPLRGLVNCAGFGTPAPVSQVIGSLVM